MGFVLRLSLKSRKQYSCALRGFFVLQGAWMLLAGFSAFALRCYGRCAA